MPQNEEKIIGPDYVVQLLKAGELTNDIKALKEKWGMSTLDLYLLLGEWLTVESKKFLSVTIDNNSLGVEE